VGQRTLEARRRKLVKHKKKNDWRPATKGGGPKASKMAEFRKKMPRQVRRDRDRPKTNSLQGRLGAENWDEKQKIHGVKKKNVTAEMFMGRI